jgi:hypothetical protein
MKRRWKTTDLLRRGSRYAILAGIITAGTIGSAHAQQTSGHGMNSNAELGRLLDKINQNIRRIQALEANLRHMNDRVGILEDDMSHVLDCGKLGQAWNGTECINNPVKDLKFATASFSPRCAPHSGCRTDNLTAQHACEEEGYNGFTGFSVHHYDSPGDNSISHWNGSSFVVQSARAAGNSLMQKITCYKFSYGDDEK